MYYEKCGSERTTDRKRIENKRDDDNDESSEWRMGNCDSRKYIEAKLVQCNVTVGK